MTETEQSPESSHTAESVDLRRIERCLQDLIDSPIANRCVTCGHTKHNELGYCQVRDCACGDGTTVAGCASIIRRDLPKVTCPSASEICPRCNRTRDPRTCDGSC